MGMSSTILTTWYIIGIKDPIDREGYMDIFVHKRKVPFYVVHLIQLTE